MSMRSANNKRNSLDREVTGVARKSAASAKPARAAGSTVRVVATSGKEKRKQMNKGEDLSNLTKEEKKARKKERRRQEDRVYAASDALLKEDPDYNRYQRVWWAVLIIGIVALVILWLTTSLMSDSNGAAIIQIGCLIITYGCVIGAIIFDLVKIRPIRNRCQSVAQGLPESKINAILEKAAAEEDRKEAEKAAARAAKKANRKKK